MRDLEIDVAQHMHGAVPFVEPDHANRFEVFRAGAVYDCGNLARSGIVMLVDLVARSATWARDKATAEIR